MLYWNLIHPGTLSQQTFALVFDPTQTLIHLVLIHYNMIMVMSRYPSFLTHHPLLSPKTVVSNSKNLLMLLTSTTFLTSKDGPILKISQTALRLTGMPLGVFSTTMSLPRE